jgi:hypothetical protein
MTSRSHALFARYPLDGRAVLSTGEVPTPYHIYDGYGLFIGGTAALTPVQQLLEVEAVAPLQTARGDALMGIWVCDFTDASLGAHHELQFSFFTSNRQPPPIAREPLSLLAFMLTRPDVQMLCHGLWNNTPTVVAYNRELLSLNARLADSSIVRRADCDCLTFEFKDQVTGQLVLSGEIHHFQRASWCAGLSLMSQVGISRGRALARQPWVGLRILNPLGVVLNHHATAETFTKNDRNVLREFDPRADKLEFGETPYRSLQLVPRFVQYMDGFRFVYLPPH